MNKKMALSVSCVSKNYLVKDPVTLDKRVFWALKDVSFDVPKGICLGLAGENGSGKSTLLKIISRIVTPTKGNVRSYGKIAPLLDLKAGFHDELTGRENAFVYASLIGIKRRELKQKFDSIVEFAGVERFIETKLKAYSSGMKMRLAFSIASTLAPDILLADEILAVGDEEFQEKCIQRIISLKENGSTIVMVQHDSALINQLCDQKITLDKGRLTTEYTIK